MYINMYNGQKFDQPSISPETINQLIAVIRDSDYDDRDRAAAKNIIIEKHFYIINKALRYTRGKYEHLRGFIDNADFEDEGMEYLIMGINNFDVTKNVPLEKYLFTYITFKMKNLLISRIQENENIACSLQDEFKVEDDLLCYADCIGDPNNFVELLELKDFFQSITSRLSDAHMKILKMKMAGYTNEEVREMIRKKDGNKYSTQRIQQMHVILKTNIQTMIEEYKAQIVGA